MICELFGIPQHDTERVIAWFGQLVGSMTGEGFERAELMVEQFENYLADLIRRRRADPADDLISALVAAQERGDQLSDDELLSTCFVLLTAGDQTTTNLIGNGTLALLRHPDQLRRLQQDSTLICSAVEELVRYDTPTQIIIRVVAEAVKIGGQTLAEGDLVYLVLAATNRDPDRFADPDQLDLGRTDNRHLGFGNGPHFCLGAPLAACKARSRSARSCGACQRCACQRCAWPHRQCSGDRTRCSAAPPACPWPTDHAPDRATPPIKE